MMQKRLSLSRFLTLEWMTVGIILILAAWFRFFRIGQLTVFTYDQGRDLVEVEKIVHGDLSLVGPTTGIGGVFVGPFHYYALVPAFIWSDGSPVAVAKWVAFWSWLSLIPTYFLLKKLLPLRYAVLGLLMVTISMGSIDLARVIWNPSWTIPVLVTATWLLFLSLKRPKALIPSLFLAGMSLQTELVYSIFVFPLFGWWIWKYRQIYSKKLILISLFACATTFIPQIAFELRNEFIMSTSLLHHLSNPEEQATWLKVLTSKPPSMWAELKRSVFGNQPLSTWMLAVQVVLIGYLFRQWKNLARTEQFFVLWAVLPILGHLLSRGNQGQFFSYYLTPHFFPLLVCLLIVMHRFIWFDQVKIIFLTLYVFICAQALESYYNPRHYQYNLGVQLEALNYPRRFHTRENYTMEVFVANLLPMNYEYLNKWLSQTSPADYGIQDKHQEYFLIYEPPDQAADKTLKPWLEHKKHNTDCLDKTQIGIITIERCVKK